MSIVKLNNRSVKDITAFGSITSLGSLTHIATQTASSSSSINFTSGIDSTYKEYIFYFVNIHPSTQSGLYFNGSIDSGSNYNVAKTTTYFLSRHAEDGSSNELSYKTGLDLSQGTGLQPLSVDQVNDNDSSVVGFLHLFNPSSTVFVKHYISRTQQMQVDDSMENYSAGYFNTTSAITGLQFKMGSGNVDSGTIKLYGIKDS